MLDLLANATLLAQAVEGKLPSNVVLEIRGLAAWTEDKMFVRGSFRDDGSDFVLSGSSQLALVEVSIRDRNTPWRRFLFPQTRAAGALPARGGSAPFLQRWPWWKR